MADLPPVPYNEPMAGPGGVPSNAWAAFFRGLIKAFGGSVVSYPISIANGGTGKTTQQDAINALTGTQAAGKYLRSNGTNAALSPLNASDLTGTIPIAQGGTGSTTQQSAIDALTGTQSAGKYLRSDGTHATLDTIHAADVPTLNQNTTGTAANVTGTVAIANGGTGQTTQQAAIDALAGTQSSGKYLRSDGTHTTLSSIQAGDVPTLNQNTTGTASNVTGTVAIANGGTGQTTANAGLNALLPTQTGNNGKYLKTDGTNTSWASATATYTAPTVQKFTSGSGTYTTPANVLYLRVRMVGGGGGGAGSGDTPSFGGNGGDGGNTTFGTSLLVANGGAHGVSNGGAGGAGGTASLGTGPIGMALQGGTGGCGNNSATASIRNIGGYGAASPFGGAGSPVNNAAGAGAITNSGSGGGGGSLSAGDSAGAWTGGGGGAGGFVDAIINSPSASYSYAVGGAGTAGTAGTNGFAGGAGGSGFIIVEEHYQ